MRLTGDDALTLATLLFFALLVVLVAGWWLILTLAFCAVAGDFWGRVFGAVTAVCLLLGFVLMRAAGE